MKGGKNKELETSESFGGSDKGDWDAYRGGGETPSYNKPDHLRRSVSHQPNHLKFLNKLLKNNKDSEGF